MTIAQVLAGAAKPQRRYLDYNGKSMPVKVCLRCGRSFKVYPCLEKKAKYCSKHCAGDPHLGQHAYPQNSVQGALTKLRNPNLMPTKHPTVLDIAWAAGIYEGEGYCRYGKRSIRVSIAQKDPEILYRFQALFGGSIYKRKVSQWNVCGIRGRGFLYTVFPFLSRRRKDQARVALQIDGAKVRGE